MSNSEASTSELVQQLTEQTRSLVRDELELAKVELTAKGKDVGIGAGLFGGASVFGLFALGALTAAIVAALSLAMATWLAALITAVLWAAVAGVMALMGKRQVKEGAPPVPEETVDSVKRDADAIKTHARRGRQ